MRRLRKVGVTVKRLVTITLLTVLILFVPKSNERSAYSYYGEFRGIPITGMIHICANAEARHKMVGIETLVGKYKEKCEGIPF
jgi:hypothetical protein